MKPRSRLIAGTILIAGCMLSLSGCSRSFSNPCELIAKDYAAAMLGTPALVREAWKRRGDKVDPTFDGSAALGKFGFKYVYACSIEAASAEDRDKGAAFTVFFTQYNDEARAKAAYSEAFQAFGGVTFETRKGKGFITKNPHTGDSLSIAVFREDRSLEFSLGKISEPSGKLFASNMSREL